VTAAQVDVFSDATPGPDNYISLYLGNCSQIVADVNPAAVGATVLNFGPGLAIPAGSQLSARASGGVQAEVYAYGYSTSASSVPAVAESGQGGPPPQQ
jgi:hypothetical protein